MTPRKIIDKIYKKRGGDWYVLIFFLLLAFFMWSMYRLSLNYSSVFEYKVNLSTNLVGRSSNAISHNSLIIRGRTTGFLILQQRIEDSEVAITIDAQYLKQDSQEGDLFWVSSNDIRNAVQISLGADLQIESVISDTLFFNFPPESYKKVPVKLSAKINCKPQYAILTGAQITPDSVYIYGETNRIETIDYVETRPVKENMADSPIQGVVKLDAIDDVRISESEVYYAIDVQRYYENSCIVPISVINNPAENLITLFPQEVTITYWALYQKRGISAADFNVVADYSQLTDLSPGEKRIRIELLSAPEGLYNIRISPQHVGCIIN